MSSRSGHDLLAPPLILATPFVSFVNHNDYSYAAAEVWISLAGLIAVGLLCGAIMALGAWWLRIIVMAGLVTLFVDLQFDLLDQQTALRVPAFGIGMLLLCWLLRDHLSRIAAPAFATMLAATLALPGSSGEASLERRGLHEDPRRGSKPAPPVLVHLIFDGFIGPEGIPSDIAGGPAVRDQLRSFFHANGFHLFGRAYSRFIFTKNAIPNALNYTSIPENYYFMQANALSDNKYFEDMYERGYNIHVYQTDAIDFCTGYEMQLASCRTFISTGIKPLEPIHLSLLKKAEVMVEIFSRTSEIQRVLGIYYSSLREKALDRGYELPPWVVGRYSLAPERALHALDIIADDVARAPAGEMFFVHLLLPHTPYVLERTCDLRDPKAWDVQTLDDERAANPAGARARHYALYLDQILCVRAKLQEMFDGWRRSGIYERMKIIVHGDHGSRIFLHHPVRSNKDHVLASDYTDSFSTLFAVKAPGLEPAYDARMVAIQDLLGSVAHERPLDQLPTGETEPYVLLENGASMVRRPMPEFGDPRGEHRRHLPQP